MTSGVSGEVDFVSAFKDAWRRVQKLLEKNLASAGLTVSELRILRSLSTNGPAPMTRLAGELFMTPASVTGLIDKLEEEKLVERQRGTVDRRVVTVKITGKGSARLEEGLRLNSRFAARALRSLSKEEVEQLIDLLERLGDGAASA